MTNQIRIGVMGLTHDHIWDNGLLEAVIASDAAVLVAAADPNKALREQFSQRYNGKVYPDYDLMLEREQLDAVFIYADNAAAADLTEMATTYGLHIIAEKPMAATLLQAERMVRAATNAGTILMINWPFAWNPALRHAIKMAQDGAIGQLYQTRYRAAHAGPKELGCTPYFYDWLYDREKNGAGALIDYCCYGAVLARVVLGQPNRVTAMAGRLLKEDIAVDDNAVILMRYPHAIAISEASWTQVGQLNSYQPAFYGSEGMLLVQRDKLLLATAAAPQGIEVDVPESPPEFESGTAYFLSRIQSGAPVEGFCNALISRDAQEILAAGLLAAQSGTAVSLPLDTSLEPVK